MSLILALETSCDETAAALVQDGRRILSNVVASQVDLHRATGGIVPEVASREHVLKVLPVLEEALAPLEEPAREVDAVAVTHGPGLAGSLLVGVNVAKALAFAWRKPLLAVHHL
ncbi:MAG: tRNA (adenosine(37)-N6)-threonylcarbamoyltransferase complex transferase subunit TsaD, partial [Chloroflexia bacterium]